MSARFAHLYHPSQHVRRWQFKADWITFPIEVRHIKECLLSKCYDYSIHVRGKIGNLPVTMTNRLGRHRSFEASWSSCPSVNCLITEHVIANRYNHSIYVSSRVGITIATSLETFCSRTKLWQHFYDLAMMTSEEKYSGHRLTFVVIDTP